MKKKLVIFVSKQYRFDDFLSCVGAEITTYHYNDHKYNGYGHVTMYRYHSESDCIHPIRLWHNLSYNITLLMLLFTIDKPTHIITFLNAGTQSIKMYLDY